MDVQRANARIEHACSRHHCLQHHTVVCSAIVCVPNIAHRTSSTLHRNRMYQM
jgi:hypothetical protein